MEYDCVCNVKKCPHGKMSHFLLFIWGFLDWLLNKNATTAKNVGLTIELYNYWCNAKGQIDCANHGWEGPGPDDWKNYGKQD